MKNRVQFPPFVFYTIVLVWQPYVQIMIFLST